LALSKIQFFLACFTQDTKAVQTGKDGLQLEDEMFFMKGLKTGVKFGAKRKAKTVSDYNATV